MLKLLFALLLAVGAGLAALGLQLYRDDHAAADWISVQATVVDLLVRSPGVFGAGPQPLTGAGHIPLVVFEWEVDGQRYRSTRYRLGGPLAVLASREDALQLLSGFHEGQSLTVYRHPEQAERAVIEREGSPRGLLLAVTGVFMGCLGITGILLRRRA